MKGFAKLALAVLTVVYLSSCSNTSNSGTNGDEIKDQKAAYGDEPDTIPVAEMEVLIDSLGNTLSDTLVTLDDFFSKDKYGSFRKYHQSGHVDDPCPKCNKQMSGRSSTGRKKIGQFVFYRPPLSQDVVLCFNTNGLDSVNLLRNHWAVYQKRDVHVRNTPVTLTLGFELCDQPRHDDCPHQHPHPQLPPRFNVVMSDMTQYNDTLRRFQTDIYTGVVGSYGLVKHDSVIILAINNKKLELTDSLPVQYRLGHLKLTHNSRNFSVPVAYDIEKK